MTRLLVVSNLPSDNTRKLFDAVVRGASCSEFNHMDVRSLEASSAGPEDVLWCDGIILGTTENFGYMSGLVKDFLERIYYPCLEQTEGKPAALYVKGGLDGQGAKTSMERVITGLRWSLIRPTSVFKGDFDPRFIDDCEELGMTMAAGLDAGIF